MRTHPAHTMALLGALLLGSLVPLATASAVRGAAPPPNDSIKNATVIRAIPTSLEADTRQATGVESDGRCVGGASVWYRYRPQADARVWLTTQGSDYDTVLAVFSGSVARRTLVTCNDDRLGTASAVRLTAEAGTTYWIAVSSCCRRSAGGGAAQLHLIPPPPPPSVEITAESATTGGISGRLVVVGSALCETWSTIYLYFEAHQRVGQNVAQGYAEIYDLPCTPGEEVPWRVRIDSMNGWAYRPSTPLILDGYVSNWDGFRQYEAEFTATLTPTDDPAGRPRTDAAVSGSARPR